MRILLGITGGIAAYKAVSLVRSLSELGHDVEVLPTENALRFVGKVTLEAISGKNIDIDMYNDVAQVRHVELGQSADLVIVAPATASFIGRLAGGIADDLLLNAIMASSAPVVICPAMHTEMWTNAATQENVSKLEARGIRVMQPASGRLTGSDSGVGRLPEVEDIISFALGGPLSGKRVVVTAGGTREPIDAVRFIGNHSSGRMGLELAVAARNMGAQVTLIAANLEKTPTGVEVIHVGNVEELENAMQVNCDVLIMAAAVSDYNLKQPFAGKLKRAEVPELQLTATKDLIASFAAKNKLTYCVAFALVDQQSDLETIARQKLWDKGVQMVVGNTTEALGSSNTDVLVVEPELSKRIVGSKSQVASEIVGLVAQRVANR
ncbi:MAG: bifunctional phosphopantothenoylcysteine decarboxylase/phosphopantothenate--cysteine ligase CoaBC [Actinomycetota bacterium]